MSERYERFEVLTPGGILYNDYLDGDEARYRAARLTRVSPDGTPARVRRLVELRDDEQITPKEG